MIKSESIIPLLTVCANSENAGCARVGGLSIEILNRQRAEIERLKKKNTILSKNADTAFQDGLNENRDLFKKEVEPEIRNEAIKKFAERLKGYAIGENGSKEKAYFFVEVQDIDNLVKEMTEAQE